MYGKQIFKFKHKKTTTLDILAEFLLDVYSIVCVQLCFAMHKTQETLYL